MSKPIKSEWSRAQATEVAYELHTLGWKAFQNLCVTITGEVWGQTVQSFFDSHDAGRDGAFHGNWKTKDGETFKGSYVAQCKFTATADKQLHLSDLKDELKKTKRLAELGLSDNYFLFSNARITGASEIAIREEFLKIAGIKHFQAYGADRISLIIRESSRLRMLVPRVYGLGDLSQILDERSQEQARGILSALGDDLAKFVITDAYQRSARALVEHGFVLLLGEPACGKSTIAAALAVGALDEWDCSTFKVRNADDFHAHWNPHEPKQFFWVDDAFGATQFDWSSAVAWNRVFPHMHAAIRRGARVLFTSRDYIYSSARNHLKESAFPIIRESQVVIHVEQLSKEEREQILYNHVRLGRQPKAFKTQTKPYLEVLAAHPRFKPETARRLGDPLFTKKLFVCRSELEQFVANPAELLCEIVRTIDAGSKSAMALVFMRGGTLPSPIRMSTDEEQAVSLMGGSASDVRTALSALDGSIIQKSLQDGEYTWRFKHPTIRDAFAEVIAEDRELMDIYLTGAPIDRMFDEITCGDVGIQGVKVIIPKNRYDLIIRRLHSFDSRKWENQRRLHHFLAYRCDQIFLQNYIAGNPNFVASLHVGSYLYAVSDVDVIVRLHEFGLLPDAKRVEVFESIRYLAVETPDPGFLAEEIRNLLTAEEFEAILDDLREKLLPSLEDTISQWRGNYNSSDDPETHFDDLVSALKKFRHELGENHDAISQIDSALAEIKNVIIELESDQPREPDSDDFRGTTLDKGENESSRSIFDDVDQ